MRFCLSVVFSLIITVWFPRIILAQTTITSFSPIAAKPGDTVTLTGTNFNTTPASNIVFFGSTKATVTAATNTTLIATVPIGVTYGYITVLNTGTGLIGYSKTNFTPTYNPAKTSITSGDFLPKADFTAGLEAFHVAMGDLDGDGKVDLVVANISANTISVYRNTSTAGSISGSSFAPKVDFATGVRPRAIAIGDLNGDGKPDLAVAINGASTVSVFPNTSTPGTITTASFAAKIDYTTGFNSNPSFIAVGDLDGDGKPDLATANSVSNNVSVLRNSSAGGVLNNLSFTTKVDFAAGTTPTSIAIGDLDGDGKPDLAIANLTSATVSVLRNTSNPGSITAASFAAKVDFITGIEPIMVKISDLDGNGKPDLVVAASNVNGISILLNTATPGSITSGSFAPKVDIETGVVPSALAVGDLDGDGGPDLVIGWAESVSVFRLIPGGFGFEPRVDFATVGGSEAISIAVGDVDGDGEPDLAVANNGLVSVSILRNTATPGSIGTGSFAPSVNFFTGSEPRSISAGDLNGDGKPDLAVANISSNTLTVLRNTATPGSINSGSFAAKVDFVTGTSPRSVAIGDLDGDGKPDLVAANNFSASVSVLRNADLPGVMFTFTGSGNWNVAANWAGNTIPPTTLPANAQIVINSEGSTECILNVPVTVPKSSSITVAPGKRFIIQGNLTITQ
jgi:hypothetical protein